VGRKEGRIIPHREGQHPLVMLLLNMVDNSTCPFQTHFGPVDGHDAVQRGHVTLE
jgi:hypothetical protein